jgi:hypothetical protein
VLEQQEPSNDHMQIKPPTVVNNVTNPSPIHEAHLRIYARVVRVLF